MSLDADVCYQALLSRDARFDGKFFTAVTSTGIYCRPVCPARTPKRSNVRFYLCAAAAEEAGFRPCRRCRPETAPWTPAWQGSSATVARAMRWLEQGAIDSDNLVEVADRLGISERHLRRLFVSHLGTSPIAVARTRRVHLARRLIDETRLPMTQIAAAAGFASLRNFNQAIRASFGASPSELRARTREPRGGGGLRLQLTYRPPFAWDALIRFFANRAIAGVEQVTEGSYRRTVTVGTSNGLLEVSPRRDRNQVEVTLEGLEASAIGAAIERVRRLFDLGADPLTIDGQLGDDPFLGPRIARLPGLRVPGGWDGFEIAVRAVVGQQISVAAARTVLGRLVARTGTRVDDHVWFPTPDRLAGADLDGMGLPRARVETLRRLARAVADGEIDFGLDDVPELARRLCSLPGIGEWTAQYVALRALGDPDVFLAGDLGVRRALAGDGGLPAPREAEARAEAWRPWRSYAVMHLWLNS